MSSVVTTTTGSKIEIEHYSLDHFIPWSFVAHDLNWNLCPVPQKVNSSKSNNIPSFKDYFFKFSQIQFTAFNSVYNSGNKRLLEDYSIILYDNIDSISNYSLSKFKEKLHNQISPIAQIAVNMGFSDKWIYIK